MHLDELDSFIRIARLGSFSAAAEQMHISQPAMSKRIQSLESRLGVTLFDRLGKRVRLTPAGELLVGKATAILDLSQDIGRDIDNLANSVSGRLSMATSHHIGLHRLAPVLQAFTHAYPNVELDIQFEDSEVAHQLVSAGDIELAVVTLNPAGEDKQSDLQTQVTWHDPLCFVGAKPMPEMSSLAQLATLPCILPGRNTFTGRIVTERFTAAGLALKPALSTNYLETISMLVKVGLGWSVLPKTMTGGLHEIFPRCAPITRTLGHVTHSKRTLSNSASAFLGVLQNYESL
ncbi:MAG: LysR family transcriptional regulator [Proteobacteria bacterium]|nr:LysR family transcriptional regulator [Pseudomonadota bacterium]